MNKTKIIIMWGLVAVIVMAGVLRVIDNLFRDEIEPSRKTSEVVSDAVSGNVETEVEVNKDGSVKVYTNEVTLTAKRDIRQGEEFKVDLGVHTISRPVQYSDATTWSGASAHGVGFGISGNQIVFRGFTYGIFVGLNSVRYGERAAPLMLGVNLGYYFAVNKHCFVGYDVVNNSAVLGIGVRW